MTTNKEIYEKLQSMSRVLHEMSLVIIDIRDKITFVPADEGKDLPGQALSEEMALDKRPIEGGREEPEKKTKTISMLNEGMTNVRFAGDIEDITDIKTYTRKADGSEGRYQRLTIMDNTGNIIMTLWDDEIEKFAYVRVGDYVVVDAWQITTYKTQKQAKLGKFGKITVMNEVKEKHVL